MNSGTGMGLSCPVMCTRGACSPASGMMSCTPVLESAVHPSHTLPGVTTAITGTRTPEELCFVRERNWEAILDGGGVMPSSPL